MPRMLLVALAAVLRSERSCDPGVVEFTSAYGPTVAWSVVVEGPQPPAIACPLEPGRYQASDLAIGGDRAVPTVPGSRLELECDNGTWRPRELQWDQQALEREPHLLGCFAALLELRFQEVASGLLWAHGKQSRAVQYEQVDASNLLLLPAAGLASEYEQKFLGAAGAEPSFARWAPRAENQLLAAALKELEPEACRACGLCRFYWRELRELVAAAAAAPDPGPWSAAELRRAVPNWAVLAAAGPEGETCAELPPPERGRWALPGAYEPAVRTSVEPTPFGETLVEWSESHLRVPKAEDPLVLPWAHVSDTEPTGAVLLGLGYKRKKEGKDHRAMHKALAAAGVPVHVLGDKVFSKKQWQCGLEGGSLFQPWVRDYGLLYKKQRAEAVLASSANATQPQLAPLLYDLRQPERFTRERLGADRVEELKQHMQARPFLALEGGNLYGDGRGGCVSTTALLEAPDCLGGANAVPLKGAEVLLDSSRLRAKAVQLMRALGCHTWVFLDAPDLVETGHVDIFLSQLADRTFGLGRYSASDDPYGSLVLSENARRLAKWGPLLGWTVEELPMPPNLPAPALFAGPRCRLFGGRVPAACAGVPSEYAEVGKLGEVVDKVLLPRAHLRLDTTDARVWRTYANSVSVVAARASLALVPKFDLAALAPEGPLRERLETQDAEVARVYARHFATVKRISQDERVLEGGSLHCLTRQVPLAAFDAEAWRAARVEPPKPRARARPRGLRSRPLRPKAARDAKRASPKGLVRQEVAAQG